MTGHQFTYNYGEHTPNHTVTVEVDRDASIEDMLSAFRAYLAACGYHPDTIKDALGEE